MPDFCDYTICPRSNDQFYIVSYYIKWVTTFSTHSILPTQYIAYTVFYLHCQIRSQEILFAVSQRRCYVLGKISVEYRGHLVLGQHLHTHSTPSSLSHIHSLSHTHNFFSSGQVVLSLLGLVIRSISVVTEAISS